MDMVEATSAARASLGWPVFVSRSSRFVHGFMRMIAGQTNRRRTVRVLVTGHLGYIGSVLAPKMQQAGHEVVGLDTGFFEGCTHGPATVGYQQIIKDVRDVDAGDLEGIDAVAHLAALSNDPLGDLNPDLTYAINHRASVRLAELAKENGAQRFVFASSCSTYGAAGPDDILDESADFNPVTAYGDSKVRAEGDIGLLADDSFSPVYLRNATAYGWSPYLRADVVVNNLSGWAFTKGEVMIKSDGSPWRPLVHLDDICAAFIAAIEAPREAIHNQAFNVGQNKENYQIRDVAEFVRKGIPNSSIEYAPGGEPDTRCYRVNFSKITEQLPGFVPSWTVPSGVEQLRTEFAGRGLSFDDLEGSKFMRIKRIQEHIDAGKLDLDLRWQH